jgi:hypothetical protein
VAHHKENVVVQQATQSSLERQCRARRLIELARLRAHAERRASKHGGLRGRIRPAQRRLSIGIDLIEAEIQMLWFGGRAA